MKQKIIYTLASGFGSGFSPYIPGTAGSAAALGIYILIPLNNEIWSMIALLTLLAGIPLSASVEKEQGKDPKIVVIDEFVGQWITLLFLPRTLIIFIAGFFLFRLLDIIKPYPAGRMERLPGGLGIMLDDVMAGIYANIILQIISRFFL